MSDIESEAYWYHQVAVLLQSNYSKIKTAYHRHGSWRDTWSSFPNAHEDHHSWEALRENGIRVLLNEEAGFPTLLREIPLAPFGLYYRGTLLSEETSLAVVGTRAARDSGKECARAFAYGMAQAGCTIVSGLALGIDAQAHEGALEAQGRTIAVFAGGLDKTYPRLHDRLAKRIIKSGGALVSEYPPGALPLPYRFLERNRIISGLCLGVVLVESPSPSGSLATARFALEQNREVFVVPGQAHDSHFAGSHELIRQGARLVVTHMQILEELGIKGSIEKSKAFAPENDVEALIWKIISSAVSPLPIDKIAEVSELEIQVVHQTIAILLLKHAIKETSLGYLSETRYR